MARAKKKVQRGKKTPVREGLRGDSSLLSEVKDGLNAMKGKDRALLAQAVRPGFADSLDVDAALKAAYSQDNRWDYLLGHGSSAQIIALEPHSAKQDEISTVIKKRQAARDQLKGHLKASAKIAKWLWVASGKNQFANTEKTVIRLSQEGIEFVGGQLMAKHLPAAKKKRTVRR